MTSGSRLTAKSHMRSIVIRSLAIALMTTLALCSCGRKSVGENTDESIGYADADEQSRFKEALSRAKIPFEVERSDGLEVLRYSSRHKAQVTAIQERLFGVPPPGGRNVTRDLRVRLEVELRKRGVPYRIASYHGSEYLAWEPERDDAVDAVLTTFSTNPEFVAGFQRDRVAASSEKTDSTNRSSRPREERAPAER
jgi:hypothetical protein